MLGLWTTQPLLKGLTPAFSGHLTVNKNQPFIALKSWRDDFQPAGRYQRKRTHWTFAGF